MTATFLRIAAIVRADFLIRFRRVSTVVIFLLLSSVAYLWIPAPSTGRTLMQVDGRRVLYNSAAVGMATAMLGMIFIGMAGFYVISNAVRRDVSSRCGLIMASTTMRSGEYLFGKFLGNAVFLATFMAGFMLSSMAMLIVRGEAPLQPFVFAGQYAMMVPSAIVFVSVLAIVFESIPFLSGRFGDVVYFMLWVSSIGFVVPSFEQGASGPGLAGFFDFSGMGFAFDQLHRVLHTKAMSIGQTDFDAAKGTMVFHGLTLGNGWLLPRIGSTLIPMTLLFVARISFHRFDPVRVKQVSGTERRGWLARANALAKPLARPLAFLATGGASEPSIFNSARADALLTVESTPVMLLVIAGFAIASLASGTQALMNGVLPIAFAALAVFLADVSCREQRAGTRAFVESTPRIKSHFVLWKLITSLLLSLGFLFVPIVRVAITMPARLVPLAAGILFVCALATSLGVISANPKTFIVVFLSFTYIVVNGKGLNPWLDYAGFFGKSSLAVMLVYSGIGVATLVAAHWFRARRAD
ncbi:MAG TPA: hypothetical protein VEZ11_02825 [Thermoanaerobaculia bacterium]|nr:hypothetical protein [Thermoanaerobaculia bacterium]